MTTAATWRDLALKWSNLELAKKDWNHTSQDAKSASEQSKALAKAARDLGKTADREFKGGRRLFALARELDDLARDLVWTNGPWLQFDRIRRDLRGCNVSVDRVEAAEGEAPEVTKPGRKQKPKGPKRKESNDVIAMRAVAAVEAQGDRLWGHKDIEKASGLSRQQLTNCHADGSRCCPKYWVRSQVQKAIRAADRRARHAQRTGNRPGPLDLAIAAEEAGTK